MYGHKFSAKVLHCKKKLMIYPSLAGMSLTKLSLGGNNSIFLSRESLVSDIPAGDGKMVNLFLKCTNVNLAPNISQLCIAWCHEVRKAKRICRPWFLVYFQKKVFAFLFISVFRFKLWKTISSYRFFYSTCSIPSPHLRESATPPMKYRHRAFFKLFGWKLWRQRLKIGSSKKKKKVTLSL